MKTEIPTIRLTHSLQAMLLMTKHAQPSYEVPNSDELFIASFIRVQEPLPFDAFEIHLPEPLDVYPSRYAPARVMKSARIYVTDPCVNMPVRTEEHLSNALRIFRTQRGRWFGAGASDCPITGTSGEHIASITAPKASPQGLRLILNLLSYIHSLGGLRDEHLTQVQQSKHGRLKPGTTKRRDYLLGREIKLSPELRALASADGPARYRFKSRWLVRGHFRHQPIGEGRNDRKVIWIQPHWKGPKEGPVLVPRYVAGEEA